jgi:membrane carboxypeptidase/penicillin-binding protein
VLLAGLLSPVVLGAGVLANQVNGSVDDAASDADTSQLTSTQMPLVTTVLDRDTFSRKIKEAELALQIGQSVPKEDILTGYLNVVEFSGNVYGIGAAAHHSAIGVAGRNGEQPDLYNPYTHPQQTLTRRDTVIDAPNTLLNPGSDCFTPPNTNRYTRCYPVQNDGVGYPDPISLQDALATSPNVAFVGLEARTGMPAVLQMAQRLGLRHTLASNDAGGTPITDPADPLSRNPQYNEPQSRYFQGLLSFTLGDSPVSTLEMANVSATILSGGVWCPPSPILSVADREGKPVTVDQEPCQQVVPPGLAHTLAAGLSADTTKGASAAAAANAGWRRPDIGKTGTTNESESRTARNRRRSAPARRCTWATAGAARSAGRSPPRATTARSCPTSSARPGRSRRRRCSRPATPRPHR